MCSFVCGEDSRTAGKIQHGGDSQKRVKGIYPRFPRQGERCFSYQHQENPYRPSDSLRPPGGRHFLSLVALRATAIFFHDKSIDLMYFSGAINSIIIPFSQLWAGSETIN